MKYLFAASLVVLLLCSVGLRLSFPDVSSDKPVIYWITDKNPARVEQVDTFHRWLVKEGHVDEEGEAVCELRIDTSNSDNTKKVIQSVSGVGSDVMDLYAGYNMRLMSSMGVLAPLNEPAERLGFSLDDTFEVLEPEISVNGQQYMYPCNVTARTIIANPAAFEAAGQPQPPRRWTIEEFTEAGRAYVAAANRPDTPPSDRRFFVDQMSIDVLWRSFGSSAFNETGTASGFNTGGYKQALRQQKQWIYEDGIMPTPDDLAAFATAQGYGGASLQLFGRGNFAMLTGGRYFLIQLRQFPGLRGLRAIELPHGGFPNTTVNTRAAAVYAGSEGKPYAYLFLAYLASDDYNALIVRDADALPPNPAALRTEAFLRPPDHPTEWEFHGPQAEAAVTIGIGGAYSPFVQKTEILREREAFEQLYMIGRLSLEEAVLRTDAAVNRRIRSTVERKPDLRPEFLRRQVIQTAVDERRDAGRPIPANWIFNAFFKAYYERTGRLGPDEPFPAGGEPPAQAGVAASPDTDFDSDTATATAEAA
ncbi:ABC transporter substrate-binding protein [Phycisphaera mikurensis]|uniref:Putative ABC transporter substrate binding protein n=1 Tax=Phycisphaera mikurensis (strain NBRC 102666 / KCTC 22515 / FYK2301M01) TaxID=1142394 RepID=I0IHF8_PHYMF|nr:ABC transporter substrate-binding protein [Phycisphaera mikurensis]MBB6440943.1 multiple sugar transport system substrate-binding protein [Phycisphaera mikurensis]BAM04696.1 putative ABC transporter substrate binding protein [Phycisphaera mikurensis NBRC 102666]